MNATWYFLTLIFIQLVKIFHVPVDFRFIVMLKYAFHWTPVFNTYIYLCVGHPSDFSSDFPTKMLHINITSHFPKRASCPANPILFQLSTPITFLEEHSLWSSSLCEFLRPPLPYSLLILSNLFSAWSLNTFRLYPYMQKRSHIYHLYTTRVKVMVNYILARSSFGHC
jgi:hypothetical protein